MRINYIKYHNYRCFDDLYVDFTTTSNKNIALILGVTGKGKTEMLFSFQWVLYGFDFKSLREKEETPYALNSNLYHKLQTDRHSNSIDCWVELSFTYKETQYFVKRTETFMRSGDNIKSLMRMELSYTESNGQRTPPEKDKAIIEELLSRIIPKSILEGIIFDGERMKKLNYMDEQTKETIKNVVSLVTNERLLELCLEEIKDVKTDASKMRRKMNKASGNNSAKEIEDEIEDIESEIEDNEIELTGITKNQEKIKNDLEKISEQLTSLKDAHSLEQKRLGLEKDKEIAKKNFDQSVDMFYKRLVDGYALITTQLINDVKQSLESIDVPSGLTVEAVMNILKRTRCICGRELDEEAKLILREMMTTLPPDNISSTLMYMANQFESEEKRAKKLLKEAYRLMIDKESDLTKIKEQLSNISTSLVTSVSATVRMLEAKRANLNRSIGRFMANEENCKKKYEDLKKLLKEKKKELVKASGNQEQIVILNKKENVLDLFKDAITKIKERNSEVSLESINKHLSNTYNLLSADKNRRLYLCQYGKTNKYKLLTFIQKTFEETENSWLNSGITKTLEQEGKSEKEIKEEIIIEVSEGKSTGQSKINSLAFAKAILDYSNEERPEEDLNVSHDYPFLIDSPFSEISGDNLFNVAKYIHTFAHQIILMADDQSYNNVKNYVEPYVNTTTHL